MYPWLARRLPPFLAQLLLAFWYALLVAAVFYCSFEPSGEFVYMRL